MIESGTLSVAILAGGLATRMRPLTGKTPKAMLPVHDKPFLAYQLDLLQQQGFTDIVLCLGYEGHQIEDYFGDGSRFKVKLRYSYDGKKLLGTGGALYKALPLLDSTFLVLYGDSYLSEDYQNIVKSFFETQAFESNTPLALMTVYQNKGLFDRSNVIFREGTILNYDKQTQVPEMEHIDWGLGILTHQAFSSYNDSQKFDLADLYQNLVAQKKLSGFEVQQRFYEIGSFQGLEEFKRFSETAALSPSS